MAPPTPKIAILVTDDGASKAIYAEGFLRCSTFTTVIVCDTMEYFGELLQNGVHGVLVTYGNVHLDSRDIFVALRRSGAVPFYFLDKANTITVMEQQELEMKRIHSTDPSSFNLPSPREPIYIQFDGVEAMSEFVESTMAQYMKSIERVVLLVTDNKACEMFYRNLLEGICDCEVKSVQETEEALLSLQDVKLVIMTARNSTVDALELFSKLRNGKAENHNHPPFLFVDKVYKPTLLDEQHQEEMNKINALNLANPSENVKFRKNEEFLAEICEKMGWN